MPTHSGDLSKLDGPDGITLSSKPIIGKIKSIGEKHEGEHKNFLFSEPNEFGFVTDQKPESAKKTELEIVKEERDQLRIQIVNVFKQGMEVSTIFGKLIDELSKHSENDYIYWPNRKQILDEFKAKLIKE
jgi:hypothetical protein